MVLALMTKGVNMINVGHGVMVLELVSKRVYGVGVGMNVKRRIIWY